MPEILPDGQEAPRPRAAPVPLPLIEEKPNVDFYDNRAADYLPKTTGDVLSSIWEDSLDSTAVGILGKHSALNIVDEMPGQKMLSIAELNQKYMGYGITWTEPKKEAVADFIAEAHQKKTILQNRISLGEGGVVEGSLGFGANMVRHIMDPLEFGVNVLGGAAIQGSRFAPAILRGTSLASNIARGAVEGVVTQIPVEAGAAYVDREYQNDVSLAQSLENVAMGAVYGGAFEGLGYAVKSAFSRSKRFFGSAAPREWDFQIAESSAAQQLEGRRPNVLPFEKVFDRERNSPTVRPVDDFSGRSDYVFNPIDPDNAYGKFYVGTTSRDPNFTNITHGDYKNSRTNFGNGLYGQDDAMRANGYAASTFNDAPGLIHEFDLKKSRLLAVDQPLRGANLEAINKALTELREFPDLKRLLDDATQGSDITARDVYEVLNDAPEGSLEGFNRNLKAQGYDGVHFVDAAKEGSAKANGIMLFPESAGKAEPVNAIEPDGRYLSTLRQEEVDDIIRQYNERENRMFQSREEDLQIEELGKRSETEPDLEDDYLKEAHSQAMDEVKYLADNDLLASDEKELLEFMQGKKGDSENAATATSGFKRAAKIGEAIMNAMYKCVGGGG